MIIRKIWRLHIFLIKRLFKISFLIFPAFRLHSNCNLIPVRRRLLYPPEDLHHRPCTLLALQIINILVHSRVHYRCQNNFYLAAFNITLLENFCLCLLSSFFDIFCVRYSLCLIVYIFLCKFYLNQFTNRDKSQNYNTTPTT
jgi:hypothetical protein